MPFFTNSKDMLCCLTHRIHVQDACHTGVKPWNTHGHLGGMIEQVLPGVTFSWAAKTYQSFHLVHTLAVWT